jgi:hypothetical protein
VLGALGTITDQPEYAILNACRTYAYLRDGHIFSKDEGGAWALRALPPERHAPIAMALALYRGERPAATIASAVLEDFATYMRATLARRAL